MAENLRYLPEIGKGYYVYDYQGDSVNEAKETQNYKNFGVLYNMSAAQNACPAGWHIPSDEEWKELERYLGMPEDEIKIFETNSGVVPFRGSNQGSNLLCKDSIQKSGILKENKTMDYGFRASLGGWRTFHKNYENLYECVRWWSSSIDHELNENFYIYRELSYEESGIGNGSCSKLCCLSLRCVKDN